MLPPLMALGPETVVWVQIAETREIKVK